MLRVKDYRLEPGMRDQASNRLCHGIAQLLMLRCHALLCQAAVGGLSQLAGWLHGTVVIADACVPDILSGNGTGTFWSAASLVHATAGLRRALEWCSVLWDGGCLDAG